MVFISCSKCVKFPHVFNLSTSLRRGYINVQRYSDIINALSEKFNCTPAVFREKRFFSITRLRFKTVARINDSNQLLQPNSFAILDDEEGNEFFGGESASYIRRVDPIIKLQPVLTLVDPPLPYRIISLPHEIE